MNDDKMILNDYIDAEEIANEIIKIAKESISEEDLKQGVEYIIKSKIIEKLKSIEKDSEIPYGKWKPPKARYEVTLITGIRVDALYGTLMIEYERPKTFENRRGFENAVEQIKEYIRDQAQIEARFPKYFGVVLDGYKIGFVRYREGIKNFESMGPFEVNKNNIAKLIEAILGLKRKALSAEELLKDFGPESSIARESIRAFYIKLQTPSPRTQVLYDDWKRIFSQICSYSIDKLKGLEKYYGFSDVDSEKLLFALHTYYALIMKLLAAEVAALYVAPKLLSYLKSLENAYYKGYDELKMELKDLEEGGIFTKFGIINFMEADYFAWYLDELDSESAKCIKNIINKLSEYDPSAADLQPERLRDLFKRLYQNLVPREIRHNLGEYYTPDWLAELVLNEVGWTFKNFERVKEEKNYSLAPLDLRLLDPSCGSGTFLILAITRLRQYIEEYWIDKGTALKKITKNIVGFDLNPLAVIASRTNYLIALGDLLRERGSDPIEIPVYLADSILVSKTSSIEEKVYVMNTAAGEFRIPSDIVEKGYLTKTLTVLEESIKGNYNKNEFIERLIKEVNLDQNKTSTLEKLFDDLSLLEKQGKNRIWTRVLKNSFAPLFVGKFDYVVGNPPWVNWENLSENFRKPLKELYQDYKILPSNPNAQTKVDLSMIFAYRCMDRFLLNGGFFGFLINDAAFKAMAGNGFRKFKIEKNNTPFRVQVIYDLVSVKPFEEASNRTALFIAKKGESTEFPILYRKWFKLRNEEIPQNLSLNDVFKMINIVDFYAEPLGGYNPYKEVLPLITIYNKNVFPKLNKIIGRSAYMAHEGPVLSPAGVYRVQLIEKHPFLTIIRNLTERDKKFKVKKFIRPVENELIYPILESGDVKKWLVNPKNFAIIPYNFKAQIYSESELKVKYPKVFAYFSLFKNALIKRSHYRKYGLGKPFYFIHMFSDWMFEKYKVVWVRMGNQLYVSVATPINDPILGSKPLIPESVIAFIPVKNEYEAHYICSILNSSFINLILQSIAKGGKNFASPELMKMISIRGFDRSNPLHNRLADLSKKAHHLAQQNKDEELKEIEEEIDKTVAQLYDITEDELKDIKNSLAMLEEDNFEN